jgi:hypothetical protein
VTVQLQGAIEGIAFQMDEGSSYLCTTTATAFFIHGFRAKMSVHGRGLGVDIRLGRLRQRQGRTRTCRYDMTEHEGEDDEMVSLPGGTTRELWHR